MNNSIYDTLKNLKTDDGKKQALALAADTFPGPIQTVINDYLNGVTIPLGSSAQLTVNPSSKTLDLKAEIDHAKLNIQPTSDGATITLSSTEYKDAQVILTFKKVTDGVDLSLSATMGDSLQWQLKSLWPQLLDWTPANQISFSKGQLSLSDANEEIDFTGQGAVLFDNKDFLNGAVRVLYKDGKTGVMMGVVIEQWSLGSIWPPLSALTFQDTGLIVSTVKEKSSSLEKLGLIKSSDVPAIKADFDINAGFLVFSSLQLKNEMQAIANFLGDDISHLDLFASYASGTGAASISAVLNNSFSAKDNGIFEFDSLSLTWSDPEQGNSRVTAAADGTFKPDASTSIGLELNGSITPAEGDFSITFKIFDWAKPFGLETVTIKDLSITGVVGAEAGGVTIQGGGDVKLQNPNQSQYEFEVGFEVEVVDFEVPNGIALWTTTDQEQMTLSNILEAAFALDISPKALRKENEPAVADVVAFLDELIRVKNFTFWFVEGASLQKIGDHGPFPSGAGLQANFTLLEQENVLVSAVLAEQASAKAGFSGYIELSNAVKFGPVFHLEGYNPDTKKPNGKGPQLAIAATPTGIVVPNVNNGRPVRFYSSLYIKFIDLVEDHLYALATTDNLFQLDYSVQNGSPAGGEAGTWAGDSIIFRLNPSTNEIGASFGFNFGWHDIDWGGITLWGVTLVPKISLPNFNVAAGLGFQASFTHLLVKGYFDFDFLDLHLNLGGKGSPCTIIDINISNSIHSLEDVAEQLLTTLKNEVGKLLEDVLNDVDKFIDWVKIHWKNFVNGLELVGKILKDKFKKVEKELAKALQDLGAAAAQVQQVLRTLGYDIEQAAQWVGDLFGCPIEKASNQLT